MQQPLPARLSIISGRSGSYHRLLELRARLLVRATAATTGTFSFNGGDWLDFRRPVALLPLLRDLLRNPPLDRVAPPVSSRSIRVRKTGILLHGCGSAYFGFTLASCAADSHLL